MANGYHINIEKRPVPPPEPEQPHAERYVNAEVVDQNYRSGNESYDNYGTDGYDGYDNYNGYDNGQQYNEPRPQYSGDMYARQGNGMGYGSPQYADPRYNDQRFTQVGQNMSGQNMPYQQFGQPNVMPNYGGQQGQFGGQMQSKFCKFCGGRIPMDAVVCTICGRQVEELRQAQPMMGQGQPQVIINNNNNNNNNNNFGMMPGKMKDKWVAFLLCFFFGWFGAHRYYEGKIATGILYLFTFGLGGLGVLIDLLLILFKPRKYLV